MTSRCIYNRLIAVVAMLAMALGCWARVGDLNDDDCVDVSDINAIINIILGIDGAEKYVAAADVNEDGEVDVADVSAIIDLMIAVPIDFNDKAMYRALSLPLLEVTTLDGEWPTCDYIEAPEGAFGHGITNATKVPGRLVMTLLGDTIYDSGDYEKGVSGMTLKISGNTSAYSEIKPYKIKLQAKADLLCRDDSIYGDKEWRLLRDDRALNTAVGFLVNELAGLQWTPRFTYCNVFINDCYTGLYTLCETVKRNRSCRIDVDKSGYIVERDAYWWNEDVSFKSTFFNDNRYGWTFKYPDDSLVDQDVDYMTRCINAAEASIASGTYPEHIDVESFARWLIAHDLLGTWDSGGSNLYITKRDSTDQSLLEMGCLWDFDSNLGMGLGKWSRYHISDDFYYPQLFHSENTAFLDTYTTLWNDMKETLPQAINARLDAILASPVASDINTSRDYHAKRYGEYPRHLDTSVRVYKDWFEARFPWIDARINAGL